MGAEIPEEAVKLATGVYSLGFGLRCAERGYTHVDSEDMLRQALGVVRKIKGEQEKQQRVRTRLAKAATAKLLDDEDD